MPLFGKSKYTFVKLVKKKDIPHGLWTKCPDCAELIYNKARQAAITKELAEIVAGAEAV